MVTAPDQYLDEHGRAAFRNWFDPTVWCATAIPVFAMTAAPDDASSVSVCKVRPCGVSLLIATGDGAMRRIAGTHLVGPSARRSTQESCTQPWGFTGARV